MSQSSSAHVAGKESIGVDVIPWKEIAYVNIYMQKMYNLAKITLLTL